MRARNERALTPLVWRSLAVLAISGCDTASDHGVVVVTPIANQSRSNSEAHDDNRQFVGVGSCTASGCHGGGSTATIVGSEYNIWISEDPHADAHSVLYDERSLQMLRLLDGKALGEPVAPYDDARCLACHSTVDSSGHAATPHLLSDGVGCEACHGPAKDWLADHFRHRLVSNAAAPDANWLHRLGMWNTDNLASRAQICARCHVGSADRDVDHDLIAAGHPRLQFDYGAYFRRLPVHWNPADDRDAWGDNLDAMSWAIGHATNSRAALDRLASRAAGDGAWPELSEWSCADCHHDLRDDVARQERLASRGALSGVRFAWDDWHHNLTRRYMSAIEGAWGVDAPLTEDIQQGMTALAIVAGDLQADRAQVAQNSAELAAKVGRWILKLQTVKPDLSALEQLFREVAAIHREGGAASWSEAALAYDALASLHQSRIDGLRRRGGASSGAVRQITRILGELYDELARTHESAGQTFRPEVTAQLLDELGQVLEGAEGGA